MRTLIFEVSAVLIFPYPWGVDGIWLSVVGAEVMAVILVIFFLLLKKKQYGY